MRYGFYARIIKGKRISLFFTMRCPLWCKYCSLKMGGDFPLRQTNYQHELVLQEWKLLLYNLFKFIDISEVIITGGEPTLRTDLSALVNFILEQRKCVILHSNLWTENGLAIKKTKRFRILSTYHRGDKKDRYTKMYHKYADKYRIDATEIEGNELPFTKSKPFEVYGEEISGMTDRFAIAPDGYMFVRMNEFYKHLRNKYEIRFNETSKTWGLCSDLSYVSL